MKKLLEPFARHKAHLGAVGKPLCEARQRGMPGPRSGDDYADAVTVPRAANGLDEDLGALLGGKAPYHEHEKQRVRGALFGRYPKVEAGGDTVRNHHRARAKTVGP